MNGTSEAGRLADLLWRARVTGAALDPYAPYWASLGERHAESIAAELYERGGVSRSWKLGALDVPTQKRLGISGPVAAPLLDGVTETGVSVATLHRKDMVAPRFEAEIGVLLDGGTPRLVPCVEVADCRFTGWDLPPYGMTVDLALQGRMLFGPPGHADAEVAVVVGHDGRRVASGTADRDEAVARLGLLPSADAADQVATGAVTALHDCLPGRWDFDFGTLGAIIVIVD